MMTGLRIVVYLHSWRSQQATNQLRNAVQRNEKEWRYYQRSAYQVNLVFVGHPDFTIESRSKNSNTLM